MAVRKISPVPAISCDARMTGKAISFDPFDTEPTFEVARERLGNGRPCVRDAAYRVDRRNTCREHLTVLVDAVAPDWDGNMVAVELLALVAVH